MKIKKAEILEIIKEEIQKINEAKSIQLKIPNMDRKKTDIILNKLKLKMGKDYDYGVGKGSTFILDLDKKFQNRVIELLMKNRIRVHGL